MNSINLNWLIHSYEGHIPNKKGMMFFYDGENILVHHCIGDLVRIEIDSYSIDFGINDIDLCYDILDIIDEFISTYTIEELKNNFHKYRYDTVKISDNYISIVLNRCLEIIK